MDFIGGMMMPEKLSIQDIIHYTPPPATAQIQGMSPDQMWDNENIANTNYLAWQTAMSNTAHQREVADLKAAGINPILSAMGGQGATTPIGSKVQVPATAQAQIASRQADIAERRNEIEARKNEQQFFNNMLNTFTMGITSALKILA